MHALGPADAAAALAVIHAAFAAQEPTDPPSGALGETVQTIAAALAHDAVCGGAGFEDAGALVAVVLWREQNGALYLSRLAVRPEHRRRGRATALIDAAVAEARRRGLPRLTLGTRVELVRNHRLFAANGFVEVGRTAHPGYIDPTSIQMERAL